MAYLQRSLVATGSAYLCLFRSLAKGTLIYVYAICGFKKFSHAPKSLHSLSYVFIDLCTIDSLLGLVTFRFLLLFSNIAC